MVNGRQEMRRRIGSREGMFNTAGRVLIMLLIAGAKRERLDTDPLTAEEIEKIVLQLFKIEPSVVSQLKKILN
jgi:hypothetical protein